MHFSSTAGPPPGQRLLLPLLPPRLGHKVSVSLIVCINWRLESRRRGTRTKGTTLSFRPTATCNCCNFGTEKGIQQPLVGVQNCEWIADSPKDVVPVRLFTLGGRPVGMELARLLQNAHLRAELLQDLLLGHEDV